MQSLRLQLIHTKQHVVKQLNELTRDLAWLPPNWRSAIYIMWMKKIET